MFRFLLEPDKISGKVDDVHSCYLCTFIRENKNFHFMSTSSVLLNFVYVIKVRD